MSLSIIAPLGAITATGEIERRKIARFHDPHPPFNEPDPIKLPLERKSHSTYANEERRSAIFFSMLDSIRSTKEPELLPKIKMISREIFRISNGIPRGVYKFRVNFALWQLLSYLKEELKKTSLKDSSPLITVENFLFIQIKARDYPSIFTEDYILQSLRNLSKKAPDTRRELPCEIFMKEIYFIRELLLRFNDSLNYHSRTEKILICQQFADNFFKEYKKLFLAFKGETLSLTKEEFIEKIKRKIVKAKPRCELKMLQIDTLRLALLSNPKELFSIEGFDIFDAEIRKIDLFLNPPLSVIDEIIKKLEANWLIVKKLPKREIPLTFFEASITRINDYFIKNLMPIPEKFVNLQIDISKAGKIIRETFNLIKK